MAAAIAYIMRPTVHAIWCGLRLASHCLNTSPAYTNPRIAVAKGQYQLDQNACMRLPPSAAIARECDGPRSSVPSAVQRQPHREHASLSGHGPHMRRAPVRFHDHLHKIQAETRARIRPSRAAVRLEEAVPHARKVVRADPDAVVGHRHECALAFAHGADAHLRGVRRMLHSV